MAAQPEKKDGYPLTRTTASTAFLIACSCLMLASCQAPEPGTGPAGRETAPTDTSGTPSVGAEAVSDLSSATSNPDGSPIVFDPVEAGKNLPDPCTELPAATLNEIGFKSDYERFTIGLDDTLDGKGIGCDLDLIKYEKDVIAPGFYNENLSKEHLKESGMFIRDAPESIVPNAYFYTFSSADQSSCCIGADTFRGRIGMLVTGPTHWTLDDSCTSALKYFDKTYEITDGFKWLEQ
ncbi:DUF3558 family protein [Corynebacterium pygosceleis]|uniref:DUF3558 family protein n=1 Tax=Corynebacterium pygosceleis TaxID=2800406 RepID=UPI0019050576|nr:DUF3558 family protein [Corynebacterium pygosceleis]MCL0120710.1 DUF3558 domain-containing protein [Corynebacterium pygosceleis]